jgi:glutaredoxin
VPDVPRVVLYSRRGCHLCDEARGALQAASKKWRFDLREVLIDDDDELERRYGVRVPVVELDGEEAFEYVVDSVRLAGILAGRTPEGAG